MQTVLVYFLPILRNIPVFGTHVAEKWAWTFNLSPAYIAQGMIMGEVVTLHMLLGTVTGWAVLSPIAKYNGWAPGPVRDWKMGSRGWITWISLSALLADTSVSFLWLILGSFVATAKSVASRSYWTWNSLKHWVRQKIAFTDLHRSDYRYSSVPATPTSATNPCQTENESTEIERTTTPTPALGHRFIYAALTLAILICLVTTQYTFNNLVSVSPILLAIVVSLVLSVMAIKSLGETDMNPVSGIGKLTTFPVLLTWPNSMDIAGKASQYVFGLFAFHNSASPVVINLVAGAISEAGAQQAGEIMHDLKTGYLLNASPDVQLIGMLIGSGAGAIVSTASYLLYSANYDIPGDLFEIPTSFIWIYAARLFNGGRLPDMVPEFSFGMASLFIVIGVLKIWSDGNKWSVFLPSGVAVAMG